MTLDLETLGPADSRASEYTAAIARCTGIWRLLSPLVALEG